MILEYIKTTSIEVKDVTIHVFAQTITHLDNKDFKINKPDISKTISEEQHRIEIEEMSKRDREFRSQGVDVTD